MLSFYVMGLPKPAGSKRAFPIFRGKGPSKQFVRTIVTDACAGSKDWKTTVAWEAKRAYGGRPLVEGPVEVFFRFNLPRAKGHYGTGKNSNKLKHSAPRHHTIKPDVLKLSRAVEDALTGIVWKDDCQIFEEHISKHYCAYCQNPGVNITVMEYSETTQPQPERT